MFYITQVPIAVHQKLYPAQTVFGCPIIVRRRFPVSCPWLAHAAAHHQHDTGLGDCWSMSGDSTKCVEE